MKSSSIVIDIKSIMLGIVLSYARRACARVSVAYTSERERVCRAEQSRAESAERAERAE